MQKISFISYTLGTYICSATVALVLRRVSKEDMPRTAVEQLVGPNSQRAQNAAKKRELSLPYIT